MKRQSHNQEIVNMKADFIEDLMEKGFTREEAEEEFQNTIIEWLGNGNDD